MCLVVVYFENVFRLVKHTGKLLEEKQEKLCIKVLQTLKDMMSVEMDLGLKVFLHVSLWREFFLPQLSGLILIASVI